LFLHFVKDQVEKLVVSLEHACHFTTAGELDSDARVDVLGKIEDRLAPGLVESWLGTLRPAVAASVSTPG
jgi:hypothetical protein